jgi:putative FmdB family regulatory protein
MPTYDYQCPDCKFIMEVTHSIKESPAIFCPTAKHPGGRSIKMERLISLNKSGGFIFKQWTESQVYKIGRDKRKQNNELDMRQIERYGSGPKLKPNVAGVETESWSDAKKLASEAGMNTASYETHVAKESNTSKISGIDDRKWKAAKEAAS